MVPQDSNDRGLPIDKSIPKPIPPKPERVKVRPMFGKFVVSSKNFLGLAYFIYLCRQ